MGIEIPESLQWVAKYILGAGDWPEGDETAMRRVADGWTAMANALDTVDDDAAAALNAALTALSAGETHDAITVYRDKLLSGDDAAFTAIRTWCQKQAEILEDGANDIEHTKLVIIGTMIVAAVEIGAAIATSWTGIGAAAGVAARVAAQVAVRVAIRQLIARMLTRGAAKAAARMALRGAFFEALEEGGIDAAARVIQVAKGDRSMDDFGWYDLGLATFGGAVGGLVGGGLGGPLNELGDVATKPVSKFVTNAVTGTGTELAADLSAQVAATGLNSAITGQEFNLDIGADTFTSAGFGGVQNAVESSGPSQSGPAPDVPDLGNLPDGTDTTPAGTTGDPASTTPDTPGQDTSSAPADTTDPGSTTPASNTPSSQTPSTDTSTPSAPGDSSPSTPGDSQTQPAAAPTNTDTSAPANTPTDTSPGETTPSSQNPASTTPDTATPGDSGPAQQPSSSAPSTPGESATPSSPGDGSPTTPANTPSAPADSSPTPSAPGDSSPSTPNSPTSSSQPTDTPAAQDTPAPSGPSDSSASTPSGTTPSAPADSSPSSPSTPDSPASTPENPSTPSTPTTPTNPTPSSLDLPAADTPPTTPTTPAPTDSTPADSTPVGSNPSQPTTSQPTTPDPGTPQQNPTTPTTPDVTPATPTGDQSSTTSPGTSTTPTSPGSTSTPTSPGTSPTPGTNPTTPTSPGTPPVTPATPSTPTAAPTDRQPQSTDTTTAAATPGATLTPPPAATTPTPTPATPATPASPTPGMVAPPATPTTAQPSTPATTPPSAPPRTTTPPAQPTPRLADTTTPTTPPSPSRHIDTPTSTPSPTPATQTNPPSPTNPTVNPATPANSTVNPTTLTNPAAQPSTPTDTPASRNSTPTDTTPQHAPASPTQRPAVNPTTGTPLTPHDLDNAHRARQARESLRPVQPTHTLRVTPPTGRPYLTANYPHTLVQPVQVIRITTTITPSPTTPPTTVETVTDHTQLATDLTFNQGNQFPTGDWLMIDTVPTSDPTTADLTIDPNTHPTLTDLANLIRTTLGLPPRNNPTLTPDDLTRIGSDIDRANLARDTHPTWADQHTPTTPDTTTETDPTPTVDTDTTVDLDAIHNQHAEQTPAGISHHRGDPTMGDLPHRVPHDPNHYTADTHITPDGHARIGNHTLTPQQYADLIRRSDWDGTTPIRLIGCDASTNGFATQLAQELGVDVLAPTHAAWTDNNGNIYSSTPVTNPDGTRSPRIPPDGQWQTHSPDGTVTPEGPNPNPPGTHAIDSTAADTSAARDRGIDEQGETPTTPPNDTDDWQRPTPQPHPLERGSQLENDVREALRGLSTKPSDYDRIIQNLSEHDNGTEIAEAIASGRFQDAYGFGDVCSALTQPKSFPGCLEQIRLGIRLQDDGFDDISFEVKGDIEIKPGVRTLPRTDMDVMARDDDGNIHGWQFKEIETTNPRNVVGRIFKSRAQIGDSQADTGTFVVDTAVPAEELAAEISRLERLHEEDRIQFVIRTPTGIIRIPPGGQFLPRRDS